MHPKNNSLELKSKRYRIAIENIFETSEQSCLEVSTRGFKWRYHNGGLKPYIDFGWKLHISVSLIKIEEQILDICNLLISERACFKLPSTLDGAILINSGQAGISQIGKLITVYPYSDDHLIEIVDKLRNVRFDHGPTPPTDYSIIAKLGLSLRWGAFSSRRTKLTSLGRPYIEIEDQNGLVIEDNRELAGMSVEVSTPIPCKLIPDLSTLSGEILVGSRRVLPIITLSAGPRARVDLALDIDQIKTCILKRARAKVAEDINGFCSEKRLANEALILKSLIGSDVSPQIIEYSEMERALVMSDVSGEVVNTLTGKEGLRILASSALSLARLHEQGVVHRDAKLANALWNEEENRVTWTDFELSAFIGSELPISAGTYGYIPPEGSSCTAHPSYDIFALGASLAKWALGIDPSRLPHHETSKKIRMLLSASGQHEANKLYACLCADDPLERPSAIEAASLISDSAQVLLRQHMSLQVSFDKSELREWLGSVAANVLPALSQFQSAKAGEWHNNHVFADAICHSINIGSSGILLALFYLEERKKEHSVVEQWILETSENIFRQSSHPTNAKGLFTGSSGVALLLAIAGSKMAREDYIRKSIDIVRSNAYLDNNDSDLFSGDAGLLYAGAIISRILRTDELVKPLELVSRRLQHRCSTYADGILMWQPATEYDPKLRLYLGAAHGASGIALALKIWSDFASSLTGDKSAGIMAADVMKSIYKYCAVNGLDFVPETIDNTRRPSQYWCHGTAGYLWCLLIGFSDESDFDEIISWSIKHVEASTHIADLTCLCHGLAGILEVLVMSSSWQRRRLAPELCQKIKSRIDLTIFALKTLQVEFAGSRVWTAEEPAEITPDLWIGFLGPAVALERLAKGSSTSLLSPDSLLALAKKD